MVTKVFLTTTGGSTTWTKDATWNNLDNTVEVVGAGARGAPGTGGKLPAPGRPAGGGAYTFKDDVDLSSFPTTVPYNIAAGNSMTPADTWFASNTTVLADSGESHTPTVSPGLGGQAANCIPSANAFSGGNGVYQTSPIWRTRGGGGAAGGAGAGTPTPQVDGSTLGGAANGGTVPGNTAGSNFQASPQFGSGGGGNWPAGTGALYGGGGTAGTAGGGAGGDGAQGLIVLTWTPAAGGKFSYAYIF
jgi:hypothetical protein